jgi:hypothetical protein
VARISQRPITWWVRRRSRQATAFSGA